MELSEGVTNMKYSLVFLAVVSSAIAILIASMTLYPFFEIGFNSLSEQYPNSKAYILSVMVDNSNIPLHFYIVGMDFTTKNIVIFDIPNNLNVNGSYLNSIYGKDGIKGVESSFSSILKINFTDFFIFNETKTSEFINELNQKPVKKNVKGKDVEYSPFEVENAFQAEKLITTIGERDVLSVLGLYPFFSQNFDTSVEISKFLVMTKFFKKEPKVFFLSYPIVNSNGVTKTDETKLNDLSIELQNCTFLQKRTSIKFTLINNSTLSSNTFSYLTWNKWSKKGYDFRIVPVICSYSLLGENVALKIKGELWKNEEMKKILSSFYPNRKFSFLSLDEGNNLKVYYDIEQIAAVNRYYDIGKTDFIILVGN